MFLLQQDSVIEETTLLAIIITATVVAVILLLLVVLLVRRWLNGEKCCSKMLGTQSYYDRIGRRSFPDMSYYTIYPPEESIPPQRRPRLSLASHSTGTHLSLKKRRRDQFARIVLPTRKKSALPVSGFSNVADAGFGDARTVGDEKNSQRSIPKKLRHRQNTNIQSIASSTNVEVGSSASDLDQESDRHIQPYQRRPSADTDVTANEINITLRRRQNLSKSMVMSVQNRIHLVIPPAAVANMKREQQQEESSGDIDSIV